MSFKRKGESNPKSESGDHKASLSPKADPDAVRPSGAYQTRWISKSRISWLRKSRAVQQAIVVDYRNGFLIVEPTGSNLGDGDILSLEMADYELRTAWCQTPKARLVRARKLLGLLTDPRLI